MTIKKVKHKKKKKTHIIFLEIKTKLQKLKHNKKQIKMKHFKEQKRFFQNEKLLFKQEFKVYLTLVINHYVY